MKISTRIRLRTSFKIRSRRREGGKYFKALEEASRLLRFSLKRRLAPSTVRA